MADVVVQLQKKLEENWLPEQYLKQYILVPTPCESYLLSTLYETVKSGIIKGPRGIDIGCGPTVHRMSILGNVCEDILACDFLPSNVNFVTKYLENEDTEVLTKSLHLVTNLQGFKDAAEGERVLGDRLRTKVKHVVQCDVTNDESVNKLTEYGGEFDCAISHGCLEAACLTYDSYVASLKRIRDILRPGASLVLCGYLSGDTYFVGSVEYECFSWDAEIVRNGLNEAGFNVDSIKIFQEGSTVSDSCNHTSCFFALSFKI